MPPSLDDTALRLMVAGLPQTRLEDGVRETIRRFRQLKDEGRLDTSDIDGETVATAATASRSHTFAVGRHGTDSNPPRAALSDFAVIVDPADNVAVVKTAVEPGLSLEAAGRPRR